MKVRILKRSIVLRNILLFQCFSLFYLHIMKSLYAGTSALHWPAFVQMLQNHPLVLISFIFAFVSVYFVTRLSSFFFAIFCLIILTESSFDLLLSFDKLILLLVFFYTILSMYFLLFYKLEKKEAVYRPAFDKRFIGSFGEYSFPVELFTSSSLCAQAILTNWDEHGCFLVFKSGRPKNLKGKVSLKIFFENLEFQCSGYVATQYAHGHGIRVQDQLQPLNWKCFYDIIHDRGYQPRYL